MYFNRFAFMVLEGRPTAPDGSSRTKMSLGRCSFPQKRAWPVSIMSISIGSRSSGLVQCSGKISFGFIDRLTAVATTVIVTAAVTVLVTAAVIVAVTVGITVTVTVTVSATAVAGTVPATVSVSVSVPGTAPCSYCFRHSFS